MECSTTVRYLMCSQLAQGVESAFPQIAQSALPLDVRFIASFYLEGKWDFPKSHVIILEPHRDPTLNAGDCNSLHPAETICDPGTSCAASVVT